MYVYRERDKIIVSNQKAGVYEILQKYVVKSKQFLRHGHEMLWFSRGLFSGSELPLSYNAKVQNAHAQLIGYEINLLNKVW